MSGQGNKYPHLKDTRNSPSYITQDELRQQRQSNNKKFDVIYAEIHDLKNKLGKTERKMVELEKQNREFKLLLNSLNKTQTNSYEKRQMENQVIPMQKQQNKKPLIRILPKKQKFVQPNQRMQNKSFLLKQQQNLREMPSQDKQSNRIQDNNIQHKNKKSLNNYQQQEIQDNISEYSNPKQLSDSEAEDEQNDCSSISKQNQNQEIEMISVENKKSPSAGLTFSQDQIKLESKWVTLQQSMKSQILALDDRMKKLFKQFQRIRQVPKRGQKLFQYPLVDLAKPNFHDYIDNKDNLLVVVQLCNGNVIVGFTGLSFRQRNFPFPNQKCFIGNINNNVFFTLKVPTKSICYSSKYLIFGNGQLRIKTNSNVLESKLDKQNGYFSYSNYAQAQQKLMGQNVLKQEIKKYEIYQLF